MGMKREYRSFDCQLETRADGEGIIEGYASVFGNVDSYNSIIQPGAFTDTLQKGLNKIKVLWNHDSDEPIGKLITAYEDSKGLFVRYRLSLLVQKAQDIYNLIRDGVIDSMSFGFNIDDYEVQDGILLIKKVNLWEVSPVTFAANGLAQITGARHELIQVAEDQKTAEAMRCLLEIKSIFKEK